MQSGPLLSLSPSFNSYSSSKMAEIAARVVEECVAETDLSCQEDAFSINSENHLITEKFDENSLSETKEVAKVDVNNASDSDDDDDEDDFEFSFVTRESDSSPSTADEIFYNGQIRPIFPVFGREIFSGSKPPAPVRLPLRKFLIEERRLASSSSSSSEADELEGVQPGTYCVWTPKRPAAEVAVERKKSNSTGSSKRWKFRELLGRSNSDGKETFVFLMPSKRVNDKAKVISKVAENGGDSAAAAAATAATATQNKRRDRVGFFVNVNGLTKKSDGL